MVLSIVAMVVVIVAGVQTNVGKKLLVSAVNHGMAGRATVRGLRGAIPWDMTIAEIELQDPAGTWGRVDGAVQVQHLPKLWMCARLSWAIGGRIDQRHGLAGILGISAPPMRSPLMAALLGMSEVSGCCEPMVIPNCALSTRRSGSCTG